MDFIEKSDWDLNKFNPTYSGGISEKIIFNFVKGVKIKEDFRDPQLRFKDNEGFMSGIPSQNMMDKMNAAWAGNTGFIKEKTINPSSEIKLVRDK